ncbi:hypothetical protein HN709_04005 [Candidatus Peregrinibacteria bacterium]|nr:hypothetical protein [Candidatus Peregrinibacteria bacterium]
MKQEQIDPEMEKLGELIRQVKKPALSDERKNLLKSQIIKNAPKPLFVYLKDIVASVVLSPERKAMLKERILTAVEGHSQKSFFWSNFFMFQKKFVSAMLVFAIGLGFFSFTSADVGVVHADTFTTLSDFNGDVVVERGGKNIELERGMRIFEKDTVRTGENGFASIAFFDDSVSRLSSETEVSVDQLVRPDDSYSKSYVEISLESGEMWSRVVNLVEDNSAFVVRADDAKTVAKKAAFNVLVEPDVVEVEVFNHEVKFESPMVRETVVSGRKVESTDSKVVVRDLDEGDRDVAWIKENLDNDKVYLTEVEERLLAAKMESVGVDVNDDFDYKASLTEEAIVFLTLGDVKKKKKELDLAEKAFVSAEVRLNDPNVTEDERVEAEAVIVSFKSTVQEFDDFVNEVRTTDVDYADELENYVDDKISNQKKNLSLALPDDASYFAKSVIGEIEIDSVDDEEELIEKRTEQGLSKIAEAEDMVDQGGDIEMAKDVLEEGKGEVEIAAELVENIGAVSEKEVIREFEQEVEKNLDRADSVQDKVDVIEGVVNPVVIPTVKRQSPEVKVDEAYGVAVEGDRPLDPLLY